MVFQVFKMRFKRLLFIVSAEEKFSFTAEN